MICLCVDSQIILTMNLWQSTGLCNGTTGIAKEIFFIKILFHQISMHASLLLLAMLMLVHNCFDDETSRGWVPIFPETVEWETAKGGSKVIHSRYMVPFCLSHPWTVWKVQGQTIDKEMVLNIGSKEKEHVLSYSAFSRARRSSDIGIDMVDEKVSNQNINEDETCEERRIH